MAAARRPVVTSVAAPVAAVTPPRGVTVARLCRPCGFIDEEGSEHHWRAGQRVVDAVEIALLVERGAEIEVEPCPQP